MSGFRSRASFAVLRASRNGLATSDSHPDLLSSINEAARIASTTPACSSLPPRELESFVNPGSETTPFVCLIDKRPRKFRPRDLVKILELPSGSYCWSCEAGKKILWKLNSFVLRSDTQPRRVLISRADTLTLDQRPRPSANFWGSVLDNVEPAQADVSSHPVFVEVHHTHKQLSALTITSSKHTRTGQK